MSYRIAARCALAAAAALTLGSLGARAAGNEPIDPPPTLKD